MDYYSNPEILLEESCNYRDLIFVHNKKLWDSVDDIEFEGGEEVCCRDEQPYQDNLTKFEKMKMKAVSGWIYFQNGTSFAVEKGEICGVVLRGDSLGSLRQLDISGIRRKLGGANWVEADVITYVWDSVHIADIHKYTDKGIEFRLDPESGLLDAVMIGRTYG